MITSPHASLNSILCALCLGFVLMLPPVDAIAMGTSSPSLDDAEAAIDDGEFESAADILRSVLEDDPDNADAYNFLAFSQRNMGQNDEAMENYNRALELDPDHKGALEYQGELFLKMGNKAAAEANLIRLGELCPRGCEEHEVLQAAIERFKDGNLSWIPSARRSASGE